MNTSNSVVINTFEINGYDDSDGIALVYDRICKTLSRVTFWTTRGVITNDRLEGYSTEVTPADKFGAMRALIKEQLESHSHTPRAGDTVEIFKGRKYPKGTVFVVTGFSEYRDCYGRVQTTYAHSEDGAIKTSVSNLRVLKLGNDSVFLEMTRG